MLFFQREKGFYCGYLLHPRAVSTTRRTIIHLTQQDNSIAPYEKDAEGNVVVITTSVVISIVQQPSFDGICENKITELIKGRECLLLLLFEIIIACEKRERERQQDARRMVMQH